MTPFGAILTAMFCVAVFALPRRYAAIAYLGSVLYITQGQTLDIAGFNCMAVRFVEVAAFVRVTARGELRKMVGTAIDRWLIYFFAVYEAALMLRTAEFDKYGIGNAVDALFVYFSFRALITNADEYASFLKGASLLLLPFAMLMLFEANTGRNLFGTLMGGVEEFSELREGHFRCQGSFRHSITAGSVGATFIPLFAGFVFDRRSRWWSSMGLALAFIVTVCSRSSGPLMGMIASIGALACWPLRWNMSIVRRGILAALLLLHLAMKQPVWFIFDRVSGVIGGDGWHRSNLIDKFILHFDKWWLWGMPMEDTGDWAATKMPWGAIDVTNTYVSIGLGGGMISIIVFITVLTSCLRLIGRALQKIREQDLGHRGDAGPMEAIMWGVGCAVCGHAVNMVGVVYWDQSYAIFYLHLAIAASMASFCLNRQSDNIICLATAESPAPQDQIVGAS